MSCKSKMVSNSGEMYCLLLEGACDTTICPVVEYSYECSNEINHPPHYTSGKIEVIDYIKDKLSKEMYEGYLLGNVIKYISRYKLKGGVTDLEKAEWYLKRLIQEEKA